MLKNIVLIVIVIVSVSCSSENLNGHFHLEFENSKNFQVWNIRDNKMRLNVPPCEFRDDNCISSQISFAGNKMQVRPWYAINYVCEYSIDENGTVTMDDGKSVMRLVSHSNCITSQEYFSEKTKNHTDSFQLLEETMTGELALPREKENELIVIRESAKQSQLLFNGKLIQKVEEIPTTQNKSIWLHIDKRVEIGDIAPILKHLNQSGYKYYFSALTNNPEQLRLLERNIESINKTEEGFEIDICKFCKGHLDEVDFVLKAEILDPEKCLIQGDTVRLPLDQKSISGYLRNNKANRLNTQIQLAIPETTTFETYLQFIDNSSLGGISEFLENYIKSNKDLDKLMSSRKDKKLPIRIKEIIKKEDNQK